jgi:hypothetical protein
MKPQSRHIIHAGINFLFVPAPIISPATLLAFQQAVFANGLEFEKLDNQKNGIVLIRETPSPFQISVTIQDNQIGQLLIIAPTGPLNQFIEETEAAIKAFEAVWSFPTKQIIKVDATIRQLYETTSPHAFQELWESRLGQQSQSLAAFGRPIRGGGLRFVMDPIQEEMPVQIEVKIESFLNDTTKIFVETQFNWPLPAAPGSPFDARTRLLRLNDYIEKEVAAFLTGEPK